jgi:hypothetical protein
MAAAIIDALTMRANGVRLDGAAMSLSPSRWMWTPVWR